MDTVLKELTAAKQQGKAALNRLSEFLEVKKMLQDFRRNVQESIDDVDNYRCDNSSKMYCN